MAYASPEIVRILTKIKYPYNVNALTQRQGIAMLRKYGEIEQWIKVLKEEREYLIRDFAALPFVETIFPSDANFFLARVTDAGKIYRYLTDAGIIVRNRHSIALCDNCLRVTVGTKEENGKLIEALRKYDEKESFIH
jgi:histidinol-phosphate aminotransferase